MKSLMLALKAKGPVDLSKRAWAIASRYGFSSARMSGHLEELYRIVDSSDARATLPVTASAAERHPDLVRSLSDRGIEFAVHGYQHVDHRALTEDEQVEAFDRGKQAIGRTGVEPIGFRAPYLRWSDATLSAVSKAGFSYDSSQAFHWPTPGLTTNDSYARVLEFCDSKPAEPRAIRPWVEKGLMRIPYSLPDDESLVDRLKISNADEIASIWLRMWNLAHDRGDLFALGIHPERIGICGLGVRRVLEAARSADDPVWVASLGEIARWWIARAAARVEIGRTDADLIQVTVNSAPQGAVLLVRGMEARDEPNWRQGFVEHTGPSLMLRSQVRPIVGIHPSCPPELEQFVRDEGFVAEKSEAGQDTAIFLTHETFAPDHAQRVLKEILQTESPLIRLARWPNASRSALAITGDVDAFTLRDYASRLSGR